MSGSRGSVGSHLEQPPQVSIAALLKKTEHYDKDERYMATSDLCEVLKRCSSGSVASSANSSPASISTNYRNNSNSTANHHNLPTGGLDATTERQICTAVLRLLHDKSNDVQAIAVKTLGVLLTTVQQEQVLEIAESLTDQVLDVSKSELRDVYAIGLRTLVKTIPTSMGHRVSQRLVGRLLDGIRVGSQNSHNPNQANINANTNATGSDGDEIVLACLDVLTDLLTRFGHSSVSVTRQHEPILQMCLACLGSPSPVIRKRTGTAMGCLSVVLSDALLTRMVEALLSQIGRAGGLGKEGRRKTRSALQGTTEKPTGSAITAATNDSSASSEPVGDTRALIRTMCTVSGAVGHRLGQAQIDRILPIFLRFTDPDDAVTGDDDQDEDADSEELHSGTLAGDDEATTSLANELRESCFMGFESFVLRCPKEVEPHLTSIIQAALAYMSYDPNYSYGEDDDGDDDKSAVMDDSGDEELEEEEEDEYEEDDDMEDDDDDESWKVRRSAIRALRAVVEAKSHDPSSLWTVSYQVRRSKSTVVAAALVGRFKEREENCRVGVIGCFTRLLQVTISAAQAGVVALTTDPESSGMQDGNAPFVIDLRSTYVPKVVKTCEIILAVKKGNERSKSCALTLLATLCKAPGGVGGSQPIASVFRHIQALLAASSDTALHRESASKALRLDALSLVYAMLSSHTHNPIHVRQSLRSLLLPELSQAVQEQWYKVIAEALRALAAVPRFYVLGYTESDNAVARQKETKEVAGILYTAVEPLLAAHDVDQEIKECALKACASLLSSLYASLSTDQTVRLLSLLLERLSNETTRIAAIKALSSIAASANELVRVDLSPIFANSVTTMSSFLRMQSRSTKQSALEAMDIVISNHGAQTDYEDGIMYSTVLQEVAPLIADSDLHLSHLAMRVTVSILQVCPAAGPAVKAHVLAEALLLSRSALLQDLALDSLLALLRQMVVSDAVLFDELLFLLRQRLDETIGKHGIYNLAKCIATITSITSFENARKVLSETFASLEGVSTPSEVSLLRQMQLSLLVTGDLGRMMQTTSIAGVTDRLKTVYLGYFESPSEDLKNAAAYALGNASVGSPAVFLPTIVSKLDEENKKQQYLLLSALREFIQCSSRQSSVEGVVDGLNIILPPLERHCSDEEEGVRTMVAECMGSLTVLQPVGMLKKLDDMTCQYSDIKAPDGVVANDDSRSQINARACWTVATSVKLAVAGKVDASELSKYMPSFLKQLLGQEELHVRLAALLMVYSTVYHMPQLVAGLFKDPITPALYDISSLKKQRKVDLGPFTHTVDDALPLRKAALSIFASSLEKLPGIVDVAAFMPVLAKALGDAEDIQLHAHQIVISMCARHPKYIVHAVDTFVEPLEKTMNKKAGQKTGTELERLNDWIKSSIRVMLAISKLEGAMSSSKFADFVERMKGSAKHTHTIEALENETKEL